jgi:hypothetical protein
MSETQTEPRVPATAGGPGCAAADVQGDLDLCLQVRAEVRGEDDGGGPGRVSYLPGRSWLASGRFFVVVAGDVIGEARRTGCPVTWRQVSSRAGMPSWRVSRVGCRGPGPVAGCGNWSNKVTHLTIQIEGPAGLGPFLGEQREQPELPVCQGHPGPVAEFFLDSAGFAVPVVGLVTPYGLGLVDIALITALTGAGLKAPGAEPISLAQPSVCARPASSSPAIALPQSGSFTREMVSPRVLRSISA